MYIVVCECEFIFCARVRVFVGGCGRVCFFCVSVFMCVSSMCVFECACMCVYAYFFSDFVRVCVILCKWVSLCVYVFVLVCVL